MKRIGLSMPHVSGLEEAVHILKKLENTGFDILEVPLDIFPFIIGGKLNTKYVSRFGKILDSSSFIFTGHIGEGLDLRNLAEYDLQKEVLMSSVNLCSALGISVLTVHYEEKSHFTERERAFRQGHREAAELAEKLGVSLCVENIETEDHRAVLECIKHVGHPNFGMTLDVGHLYLSCNYFGANFLDAIEECAPFARHIHLSDNTGWFEPMRVENFAIYRTQKLIPRITFGRGDIHIPPFMGKIPYKEVFALLKDYKGDFVCEYPHSLFEPFHTFVQETIRELSGAALVEVSEGVSES